MIRKYLQQAYDYGYEIIIQFKYCCHSRYTGKVLDLDRDNLCLFCADGNSCMSWVFKIDDLQYIGVYKELSLPQYDTKVQPDTNSNSKLS